MKLPCEMMEDLLPLYAEDMATGATRAAVEEHLADCEACRKQLEGMKREPAGQASPVALEPVRAELRRRRRNEVAAAVCAVVVLLLTVFSWDTRPIYLSYTEDMVTFEAAADGTIAMTIRGAVGGIRTWEGRGEHQEVYVEPWRYWNSAREDEVTVKIDGDATVWFVDLPRGGTLIQLLGEPSDEHGQLMKRLVLNYWLMIAGAAAAVLAAGWLLLRGKKAGRISGYLAVLALCYIAAHFLIMGPCAASFDAGRDFMFIVPVALSLWGLASAGAYLLRQLQRDRA